MDFSKRLSALLKEEGILQKDLCSKLNLSKNQVHYWIKDKAEPDLQTLIRIADFFDVSIDYLVGRKENY